MRRRLICRVVCLVVPMTLLPGCGRPEKAPASKQNETVKVEQLPKLGDLIGPLDDERVKIGPPEGWIVMSRKTGWVIRFKESQRLEYPNICVTATDYENILEVSQQNVDEFARQVAAALKQDPNVSKLTEPVTPVEIGHLVGVTHARRANPKNRVVERVFIETVFDGRRYTIELRVLKGTLQAYRPHLQAVAGGIEFLRPHPPPPQKQGPAKEEPQTESASKPQ